jgi:hypothetical protein
VLKNKADNIKGDSTMTVKELKEKLKDIPDDYVVRHLTYGTDSRLNPAPRFGDVCFVVCDYERHSIALR